MEVTNDATAELGVEEEAMIEILVLDGACISYENLK